MGVNVPSRGRISSPWRGRSRSRMISGRSSETTYEQTENLNPGTISSVQAAAKHMAAFQHEYLFARTREIGGVDQPVVASADYDDVIFGTSHQLLAPSS